MSRSRKETPATVNAVAAVKFNPEIPAASGGDASVSPSISVDQLVGKSRPLSLIEQCERDVVLLTQKINSEAAERDTHQAAAQRLQSSIERTLALRRSKIESLLAEKPGYVDPDIRPAVPAETAK